MCLIRFPSFFSAAFILCVVFLYFCSISSAKSDKCMECRFLVATFTEGLNQTSKSHFGGGNTAWEERKLGKFLTSEIRFAEVMEYVCKKDILADSSEFDSKDLQFKCHTLAEDAEETLEGWFFKFQSTQPDLGTFLCVKKMRRCCPTGHFGANCGACPGLVSAFSQEISSEDDKENNGKTVMRECFGHGRCNGSGTREGTGRCDCDSGYVGKMCSNCAAHYFAISQTSNSIKCEECFDGCASECMGVGPKGCKACRTGYLMNEQEGCKDVDECLAVEGVEPKCTKAHEICVNTAGSYYCRCENGYKRDDKDENCELDVEARPLAGVFAPDVLLRLFAIFGLVSVTVFVLLFHRTPLSIALTMLAVLAAFFVENHYEWIVPKAARQYFDQRILPRF